MRNHLHKIPFLKLFIPFVAGVVLQEKIRINEEIILIIFFFEGVLLTFLFLVRSADSYKWNLLTGILIYCILFSGGMKLAKRTVFLSRPENLRLGCIMYIPEEKDKTFKIVLGMLREKIPEGWCAIDGKAIIYLKKSNTVYNLEPGDRLLFYSSLNLIEGPANPMEFDFRRYCQNLGIFWKTYLGEEDWEKLDNKIRILSLSGAEWIRLKLVRFIDSKNLTNESLINSLLLGYRDGLTGEQQQYFAASGAMHILAVSGMHVAIIYGALLLIARIFFRRKSGCILLLPLPVIWIYAFITGMTPSVARSAIMISLWVVSRFLNRQTEALNIIITSAFFMIMAQPSVIHQVSFQLSFAAITGITLVFQGFYRRMKTGIWIADQIISICCLSVSAQLFTFPLSIFYFHQFSNYFLITNLFAVPMSGIILIAGLVFLVTSFSFTISAFTGIILDKATGLLDQLTRITADLPFSNVRDISIDTYVVVIIYLMILFLMQYFRTKKVFNLHFSLACLMIICAGTCFKMILQSSKKEIIILSVQGNIVINLISGTGNMIITDDTSTNAQSRIRFHAANYWCSHRLDEPVFIPIQAGNIIVLKEKGLMLSESNSGNFNYLQFYNMKIGVLNEGFKKMIHTKYPLNLDLLIINSKYQVKIGELKDFINPAVVVINGNMPAWIAERIEDECIQSNISCHNVTRSGYLKLDL